MWITKVGLPDKFHSKGSLENEFSNYLKKFDVKLPISNSNAHCNAKSCNDIKTNK